MPQSLSRLIVHIVFSTKSRVPVIQKPFRDELYAYVGGILRNQKSPVIKIGGTADHVHILCLLSKTLPLAKIVEQTKVNSSKWLKTLGPQFKGFHWQNGYGGFSVSESSLESVAHYIDRQEEHHRKMTFQEEYLKLLERHGVGYDERYVWD